MRLFRTSFKYEVTISGSFGCREHLFAQSESSPPRIKEKDKRETDLDEYITIINYQISRNLCMSYCKKIAMRCPRYKAEKMEEVSAAAHPRLLNLKTSPVKMEPNDIKPQCPPAGVTAVLLSLNNNNAGALYDKENSTSRDHDRSLEGGFEDSGYLSLHNSQIDDHHGDEEEEHWKTTAATHHKKTVTPKNSPSKCQKRTNSHHLAALDQGCQGRTESHSVSSTSSNHVHNTLPLLRFHEAVCEELAKDFRKNKRYDWSIVSKVAQEHLLNPVVGGSMGAEYVDMFSCLFLRNMRNILTKILVLLGGMDLISCKKVSRTWRRIICEDKAALNRCQQAEQTLRESRSSLKQQASGLTRDVTASRVVLSCMQTLASSSTSSPSSSHFFSSTPNFKVNRRSASSQKNATSNSEFTRFNEYVQAASSLKQHESLRSCRRCGSPATHLAEAQRATCMRLSCLFDFCTHCQEAFHGSTPCRVVQPRPHFSSSRSTPPLPGSARSKRSIKRL